MYSLSPPYILIQYKYWDTTGDVGVPPEMIESMYNFV